MPVDTPLTLYPPPHRLFPTPPLILPHCLSPSPFNPSSPSIPPHRLSHLTLYPPSPSIPLPTAYPPSPPIPPPPHCLSPPLTAYFPPPHRLSPPSLPIPPHCLFPPPPLTAYPPPSPPIPPSSPIPLTHYILPDRRSTLSWLRWRGTWWDWTTWCSPVESSSERAVCRNSREKDISRECSSS